jgi:imidazolonepropionase-like amidohydrolase
MRTVVRAALFPLLALVAAAQSGALVLNDINLIDGTATTARPRMRIAIRGGRIESIAPATQPPPADGALWNLSGMTVIPGLIDAHVHLTSGTGDDARMAETLRFGLLGGVTSVRDMGGDNVVLAELARRFRADTEAGPRIYYSTLVAGPQWFNDPRPKASSHGGVAGEVAWMRAVDAKSDLPAIIAAGKATGPTGLKIYADLPPDIVERFTAEAHRQGLRVWTHSAILPTKPSEVVRAGVDVASHSVYLGAEGMNPPPASYEQARRGLGIDYAASPSDSPTITNLLQLMKEKGTILDETLFVTNMGRRARAIGVTLAAGTDAFGNPARDAMPNIHQEMQLLVEKCSLTPLEAISSGHARSGARDWNRETLRDHRARQDGGPCNPARGSFGRHRQDKNHRRRSEGRRGLSTLSAHYQ